MGLQQATKLSVVLFAAATFILWIPKIVVAAREYNIFLLKSYFYGQKVDKASTTVRSYVFRVEQKILLTRAKKSETQRMIFLIVIAVICSVITVCLNHEWNKIISNEPHKIFNHLVMFWGAYWFSTDNEVFNFAYKRFIIDSLLYLKFYIIYRPSIFWLMNNRIRNSNQFFTGVDWKS